MRTDLRGIAAGALVMLVLAAPGASSAVAQDTSSWTSGTMTAPNQRPGETRLLRNDGAARKSLRPSLTDDARIAPQGQAGASGTLSRFRLPGTVDDAAKGSGALAATTVTKTATGTDPAYDAFDQGRYLTAFELATKAAEAGEPQAATLLGRLLQEGLGVKPDPVAAAQWYRRAAELGDVEGTFAFGVMLAEGEGIQKNRAGAAQLFETAAQKGHPLANYNLALLFLRGDGKPESPHRAALHLRYAAERGIAQAQYDLATLYATGTGVEPNAFEAATWLQKAADQGLAEAELEYGVWLFQGRGVLPSQSLGVQYFKSAAEKGSVVAQNRLARAYAHGAGISKDLAEAAKWYFVAEAGGVTDPTLEQMIAKLPRADRAKAQQAAAAWRDEAALR